MAGRGAARLRASGNVDLIPNTSAYVSTYVSMRSGLGGGLTARMFPPSQTDPSLVVRAGPAGPESASRELTFADRRAKALNPGCSCRRHLC